MSRYAIFEIYLAKNWADIDAGKEITCEVFHLEDASYRLVKAKIGKKAGDLLGADELWVRNDEGAWIAKDQWVIKIMEELDPDEVEFTPSPNVVGKAHG